MENRRARSDGGILFTTRKRSEVGIKYYFIDLVFQRRSLQDIANLSLDRMAE